MSIRPALAPAALVATLALTLTACGEPTTRGAAENAGGDGQQTSAAASGLDEILKDGTITVGTEGTYKPFTFHEDGTGDLTGYDIEIMDAVADKLGVKAKYVETQWDAIFAGLEAGRFDVIANQVSINPQREDAYLFSEPYTVSPGVIVVAEDNTDIAGLDDLSGKTTAQSLTSNWGAIAEGAGANVESVEGWAQAVALLEQGRVDATVNDALTFLDYTKEHPDSPIKIAAELDDASLNAFAFGKDKQELVTAFDEALAELAQDGTLAELGEKYFGADVSQ